MQACNDNDEAFEPHTNANDDRDQEEPKFTLSKTLEPQQLDLKAVTQDQQPIRPPIRAFPDTVLDHEHFLLRSAIPAKVRYHSRTSYDDQILRPPPLA